MLVFNADLGDGNYRNPILYADYSDPDVIRVDDDYFMVASSFCNVPAIPVLHSKDLVSWRVINYVLDGLPSPKYDSPAHGHGVYAPSIRHHGGLFWVCYPMPDEGIFFSTTADPFGKWSKPFTLRAGTGWIDPCPFWDDDGRAYLASAFAKSRCGINSIINMAEMKPDGTALIGDGRHIFDGHRTQPTIEGPKLYKRNGYYYILAPAGGVPHGWQTALRSKSIWGPYEEKIVMMRSSGPVNGPHQGGLVDTPSGEWWFVHFQDVGTEGRIVHLQPVEWVDDWPIIGNNAGGANCGQPVLVHKKPDVGDVFTPVSPANSDDFAIGKYGLQWQWNANCKKEFYSFSGGLVLHGQPAQQKLCDNANLFLQKFDSPAFTATAQLSPDNLEVGATGGVVVLGGAYGALGLQKTLLGFDLIKITGRIRGDDEEESETLASLSISGSLQLRLSTKNSVCTFSYGVDGQNFIPLFSFTTCKGIWVGAKHGLFCIGNGALPVATYIVETTLDADFGLV